MSQFIMNVYAGNPPPNHHLMMMGHRQKNVAAPKRYGMEMDLYKSRISILCLPIVD
jgi:hypothetical protein